jgi:prevent-host-death family protein
MRKASVAQAKAHFSELIDLAEHKGQRILILRHGKPAAAIVPASSVVKKARPRMTHEEVDALLDRLAATSPPEPTESIDELLGRRRLDSIEVRAAGVCKVVGP